MGSAVSTVGDVVAFTADATIKRPMQAIAAGVFECAGAGRHVGQHHDMRFNHQTCAMDGYEHGHHTYHPRIQDAAYDHKHHHHHRHHHRHSHCNMSEEYMNQVMLPYYY